jgi:hypothetical protein
MRFALAYLLTGVIVLAAACNGGGPGADVVVRLQTPVSPDPFQGVVKVRLSATGDGMETVRREAALTADAVSLPPLPYGDKRVITVEGLDSGGAVISRGRSASFQLTEESPESVTVFFARRERFSLLEARLATARYDHTATVLGDGRVVLAGGRASGGGLTASVEIYDPATGTLSKAPSLKRARAGHAAVASGKLVVLVAGEGAPGSVELYDPGTGTTADLALAVARTGHAASPLPGGNVLVVGGVDTKGKPAAQAEIVEPAGKRVRTVAQGGPGQTGHVAVALGDGRVLVAGGRKTPPGKISDEARLYLSTGGGSWVNTSKLPDGREEAAAVRQGNGTVVIVGGADDKGAAREAFVYSGSTFKKSGETAVDHQNHAAAGLSSSTLVAGGTGTRRAELLVGTAWRGVGELVRQRERFTLTTLLDGSALAAGGLATSALSDVEIFVP